MPGGTNSGGTNSGGGGISMPMRKYTTNDLYLEIAGPLNGTSASLVLHTPWYVTNGVYNILTTTNLAPPIAWQWFMTTAPGQTNIPLTNTTEPQRFFALGLTNSSSGTDFWVAFCNVQFYDYYGPGIFSLYISSPVAASGTVSMPGLGFTTNFSLTPGAVTNISLSQDAMITNYASITTNGVHVTSSAPVSVYPLS